MQNTSTTIHKCEGCGAARELDYLSIYDLGSDGHDLVSLCDKCLSKYPKKDAREWRKEDHADDNGVVVWSDGSKSRFDANGILCDVEEPFSPSVKALVADVQNHALAAVSILAMFLSMAALVVLLGRS